MSDDLIQSLRDTKYWVPSDEAHSDMQEKCEKAADALAAAQEENERLREALSDIVGVDVEPPMTWTGSKSQWERWRAEAMRKKARAALGEEGE